MDLAIFIRPSEVDVFPLVLRIFVDSWAERCKASARKMLQTMRTKAGNRDATPRSIQDQTMKNCKVPK
nr:hypothetical protein BaRGS_021042 [Batillaria attramentaria]